MASATLRVRALDFFQWSVKTSISLSAALATPTVAARAAPETTAVTALRRFIEISSVNHCNGQGRGVAKQRRASKMGRDESRTAHTPEVTDPRREEPDRCWKRQRRRGKDHRGGEPRHCAFATGL